MEKGNRPSSLHRYLKHYCFVFTTNKIGEKRKEEKLGSSLSFIMLMSPNQGYYFTLCCQRLSATNSTNMKLSSEAKWEAAHCRRQLLDSFVVTADLFLFSMQHLMKCILLVPGVPCVLFCTSATRNHVLSLSVVKQTQVFAHFDECQTVHFLGGGRGGIGLGSTCQAKKLFKATI